MTRAVKFSFRNIWRNIGLSFMTVLFITLAMFMLTTTVLVYRVIDHGLQTLQRGVEMTLIMQPAVTEEQALPLISELEGTGGVSAVAFVSADEVKTRFLEVHAGDSVLEQTVSLLPTNPFSPEIHISADSTDAYAEWFVRLQSGEFSSLIVESEVAQYEEVVGILQSQIAQPIRYASVVIWILFAVIIAILIFNTIRITIYTQREEIGIMKLVGATNSFVRVPYLLQTVWTVLFGIAIAYGLSYMALAVADPVVRDLFAWDSYRVIDEVTVHIVPNIVFPGVGILFVALISTAASMSRHLRV